MADDITLPSVATPGQKVRGLDDGVREWPYGGVGYAAVYGTPNTMQPVDLTHGLPVVGQTGAVWDYNLKQYNGAAVGLTNAVHVQPGTGATFAVSGTVAVSNFPAGFAVVGNVEVTNDVGNPLPVSGTFWQATQPVSGTVTANVGTTNGLALDATLTGGTLVAVAKGPAATGAALSGNPVRVAGSDGTNTRDIQTDASGNLEVVGNIAGGVADSGSPVKIGGLANSTAPTPVTAGQRVNAWYDQAGAQVACLRSSSVAADAQSSNVALVADPTANARILGVQSYLFNGTNYDRPRNNGELTVLASAARTTAQTPADLINYNARGVVLTIDVTVASGTGGLTITILGKSTLSGKYKSIIATTAITATGTYQLTVYPGLTAQAFAGATTPGKADWPLPRIWQVTVGVGDASSYTYSIDANFIL